MLLSELSPRKALSFVSKMYLSITVYKPLISKNWRNVSGNISDVFLFQKKLLETQRSLQKASDEQMIK